MKQIDEQVWWKYVDGDCSQEEKLQIDSLLAENPSLAEEMMLRSTLHHEMAEMELMAPSLDFSKNVMEALPKKPYKITETAPLVSTKMRWSFLTAAAVFVVGLFASPFLFTETLAQPIEVKPTLATTASAWFDALWLSISSSLSTLPAFELPNVPVATVQVLAVFVLGTALLLMADRMMARRFSFEN